MFKLVRTTLFPWLLLAILLCTSQDVLAQDRGLVLESYVGARPRDADYLLAPLLDELKRIGFRDSSVAGTRIHSQHSLSSEDLPAKQIESARRAVKDGTSAYIDGRFEGAVDSASHGLDILMSRPATMARQQQVREYLYEALITISMANKRLGANEALDISMAEFIRSFPDRDVSHKKWGNEGVELYRKINKTMNGQKKGDLQIAAGPGSMIFINERYVGLGSLTTKLFPGRYRIYTQNGSQAGRVHIVDVEAEREQTLVVDSVVDSSLRTGDGMVGFVFETDDERSQHERRVTLDLGKALGAESIILVGFHKFKGEDSVVASSLSIATGESGPSARVPLPKNGAPSAAQLRALASFVAGVGPASPDIEVLTASTAIVEVDDTPSRTSQPTSIDMRASTTSGGISSAWRWSSWGLGAVGIGAGAYLLSLDGTGTCRLQPGQVLCPESYETMVPGIGLIAAGTGLGLLGFYLWTREGDDGERAKLSLAPSLDGGMHASLSGTF